MDAFASGGGAGKPVVFQAALCWAPAEDKAMAEALHQWASNAMGGEVAWDLRRPSDFDTAAKGIGDIEFTRGLKTLTAATTDPEPRVRFFAAPTCHHRPEVYGGISEGEAGTLLKDFFAARR